MGHNLTWILDGISEDMGYLEGKVLGWIFLKRRIIM
jgi:hypothetical protein